MKDQEKCYLCGAEKRFRKEDKICNCCGASKEEALVAHMLVKYAGGDDRCLGDSKKYLDGKRILNIGYFKKIHEYLCDLEWYQFSDELNAQNYESSYFDFIIASDATEIYEKLEELDNIIAQQGKCFLTNAIETVSKLEDRQKKIWEFDDLKIAVLQKKRSEKAEYSGERFVPGIEDEKLEIEHMQRYQSVLPLVEGKTVLDIACGEGYGTAILAEKAISIKGIDIDEGAIQRASGKYHMPNLEYVTGSIASIPVEDHSIDVIVSFETIEHVSQELQKQFLEESKRVLKQDGLFVISTPNKEVYSDRFHYFNEFHIHEFYHDEYLEFLQEQFEYVKLYNQSFEVASILSSCAGEENTVAFQGNEKYQSNGKYYIAIASNKRIQIPNISSVILGEIGEYASQTQRIIHLQNEEDKRNRHIHYLDQVISKNDKDIARLQSEVEERNRHIQQLDQIIERDDKLIQVLQHDVNRLEKETSEIKEQIIQEKQSVLWQAEQEKQELFQQAEQEKQELLQRAEQEKQELLQRAEQEKQQLMQQLEQERQQLVQQVRNKEGHIDLLLESEREFERYKNTRGYRSTMRNRKIVNFFLPPNSKRLFILRVIKKMFTQPKLMVKVIRPSYIGHYIKYLRSDSIEEITRRYDEIEAVAKGEQGTKAIQLETSGAPATETAENKPEPKIEDYEMLCFIKQENPIVSIVIPVYNQFDYTYNCLKSILKNSGDVSYEVLIANDCSTDITKDIEKVAKNVRLITTEKNVRFLLNCNHAAKFAKGEYILFLNNDTQVQNNWLQPLIDVMDTYPEAGMVGSKLIYPDGRLQEAGGIVWKDASAWNYGHLQNPDDPSYVYLKEADYVSGAAIMIRTKLWEQIGGFDETFVPAYYEDTDLAFEVRRQGYKVYMQPQSVVVHFEGISNGTDTSSGLKAYQVENHKKFYDKWKEVLEKEHFENGKEVYLAKDRGQLKKQILVVDHYVPNYDKDAGGRCTYMYIKMFLKMGLKVTFIGDNFAHPEPYTSELNGLGVEILYGNDYYNNWQTWLKENLHYFDYVYLQRPHISIKYIELVKKYARGKIFYFAHDLHHVRMYRDYLLTGDKKALEESEYWKKIEMELFEKADVGHVVGSYEQEIMQKEFPNKPIRNIPLYIYDTLPQGIEKDFSKRKDILFVGGFGHTPNVDAVTWFEEKVYRKILQKYPDMIWHIVGSKAPDEVLKLAGPNIKLEGFVSDEELGELYKKCRMAVVPLRYGAGVKGKVVESAYYQIPLVTTPIGGEGLDDTTKAFVMEEDADKMAQLICELYEDYEKLKEMSDAGATFISQYFTSKVAQQVLLEDM